MSVHSAASPALRTTQLTRRYGPNVGVLGVNITVPRGCVYGLVGPNGAGKTTLLSMVSGLRRADSGSIELGVDAQRVALCPDVPAFEPWLTGREVTALSAALAGVAATDADVLAALSQVGLTDAAHTRVGGYSRGMTQRLGLAAALVCHPELVLLDEPSSALDPAGRAAVLDLIAELAKTSTVVLSSHVLSDVQRVADVVGVLDRGRLVFEGPLTELIDQYIQPVWSIRVRGDASELRRALTQQDWVLGVDDVEPGLVTVTATTLESGELGLVRVASSVRAAVVSITAEEADLESAFLALTQPDDLGRRQ